jgi:hypothetical protein
MTNKEKQKIRDKEKWLESQRVGYDKSGDMLWCGSCEFSQTCLTSKSGKRCDYGGTSGDYDKVPYPCATAYNRMKRGEYKNSKDSLSKNCIKNS